MDYLASGKLNNKISVLLLQAGNSQNPKVEKTQKCKSNSSEFY